jgi:hypothetical protein
VAYRQEHMKDCIEFLGEPYEKVHKWLDRFARIYDVDYFDSYHRSFRHNTYGLKCIYGMWGYESYQAARIHLIRDYMEMPITEKHIDKYKGKKFRKMMQYFDNPVNMKPGISQLTVEAWMKEGFGLVTLATKDMVSIT